LVLVVLKDLFVNAVLFCQPVRIEFVSKKIFVVSPLSHTFYLKKLIVNQNISMKKYSKKMLLATFWAGPLP
jgi:hypothetical protein